MNEKTKKWLLSFLVRTAVSLGIFAVTVFVCRIFPKALKALEPLWTKSADIHKIGTLFREIGKELLP